MSSAASNKHWPDEDMLLFINLYKSCESLWNTNSPLYTSRQVRQIAYETISKKMNMKGFGFNEANKKVNNIRSAYAQELKRIGKSKEIGGPLYEPRVVWFKPLDVFLRPFVTQREMNATTPTLENAQRSTQNAPKLPGEDKVMEVVNTLYRNIYQEETQVNDEANNVTVLCDAVTEDKTPNYPQSKKRKIEENPVDSTVNKLNEMPSNSRDKDLFEPFRQSVADHLKDLTVQQALSFQLKLHTILSEELLRCFDDVKNQPQYKPLLLTLK